MDKLFGHEAAELMRHRKLESEELSEREVRFHPELPEKEVGVFVWGEHICEGCFCRCDVFIIFPGGSDVDAGAGIQAVQDIDRRCGRR